MPLEKPLSLIYPSVSADQMLRFCGTIKPGMRRQKAL